MQVRVNDIRMGYDDFGSGNAVVFLHAFPLNRRMWEPQVSRLKERFRVVVPDLRGFGETESPPGPYSMEMMARDVLGLLDHLGIASAALVGLSMGGYVALAFCRLRPERVSSLVLADTKATPDTPESKAARDDMVRQVQNCGVDFLVETMLPRLLTQKTIQSAPQVVQRVADMIKSTPPAGAVGALLGMRDRPDSTDVLRSLRCPLLCICGAEDAVTPPSVAEEMASTAPNGRVRIIPEAGHLANIEQPDEFNKALMEFLSS
ncbi:MAG: alpha/beta fold hydrolase [Armatimonadota bacterium]